jgi:hypothetical protein
MTTLHEAAQQALKSLRGYRREINCDQPCDAERALEAALEQPEPLGPGESWEYDDGLTMTRRVYRHGKLVARIAIETIQDTPQMRPFRVAHSFGNREHRPTINQENV